MTHPGSAQIWAVFGASGTGKGAWLKQQLRKLKPAKLLIWDANADAVPEDPAYEYGEFAQRVPDHHALERGIKAARFRLRYVPQRDKKKRDAEFAFFCAKAWDAGPGTVVVVEELSQVTQASSAPENWKRLTNAGRHRGMHVIGVSQFPAQVDKSLMGNATLIHTGHLPNKAHRQAVAVEMDCDPEVIRALADLDFVEWRRGVPEIAHGRVTFAAPRRPRASSSSSGSAVSPKA